MQMMMHMITTRGNFMRTVSKAMIIVGLLIGSSICAIAGAKVVEVPEPSALLVLGSSLSILGLMLHRKNR